MSQTYDPDLLKLLASWYSQYIEENRKNQPNYESDPEFGFVPNKPIYTLGIKLVDGEEEYLNSLQTVSGNAITWSRHGSITVDGVNGPVDKYDTFIDNQLYKTIYINMYGAVASSRAPDGFRFAATKNNHTNEFAPQIKTPQSSPSLNCIQCGAVLRKEAHFCPRCGVQVSPNKGPGIKVTNTPTVDYLGSFFMQCYAEMLKTAKQSSIVDKAEFELIPAMYIVCDYNIARTGGDRRKTSNAIMSKVRQQIKDFDEVEFNRRLTLYGEIIRGKKPRCEWLHWQQPESKDVITKCMTVLGDLLINPDCADDYDSAPVVIHDIFESVSFASITMPQLKEILVVLENAIVNSKNTKKSV